jgi:hypothetical protein
MSSSWPKANTNRFLGSFELDDRAAAPFASASGAWQVNTPWGAAACVRNVGPVREDSLRDTHQPAATTKP